MHAVLTFLAVHFYRVNCSPVQRIVQCIDVIQASNADSKCQAVARRMSQGGLCPSPPVLPRPLPTPPFTSTLYNFMITKFGGGGALAPLPPASYGPGKCSCSDLN
jgi:hypothetical protein